MNWDMIKSLVRNVGPAVLSAAGGYFVAKGTLTEAQVSSLINAITAAVPTIAVLAAAIWGVLDKTSAAKTLAADSLPGVKVTVNPDVADPTVVAVAKAPGNTVTIEKKVSP